MLFAAVVRARGAVETLGCEMVAARREIALRHGALDITDPSSCLDLPDVDVLLEGSGAAAAIVARCSARPAGRADLVRRAPADATALPVGVLQTHKIALAVNFRHAPTWPAVFSVTASGEGGLVERDYSLAST